MRERFMLQVYQTAEGYSARLTLAGCAWDIEAGSLELLQAAIETVLKGARSC